MFMLWASFILTLPVFAGVPDLTLNARKTQLFNCLKQASSEKLSIPKVQNLLETVSIEPEIRGMLQAWLYTQKHFQPDGSETHALEHFFIGLLELTTSEQALKFMKDNPKLHEKLFSNKQPFVLQYLFKQKNRPVLARCLRMFPDLQKKLITGTDGKEPRTALQVLFYEDPRYGLWVALHTPEARSPESTCLISDTLKSNALLLRAEELVQSVKQLEAHWPHLLMYLNQESSWLSRLLNLPINILRDLLETHPSVLSGASLDPVYRSLLQGHVFQLDTFLLIRKLRDKNPLSPETLQLLHQKLSTVAIGLTDTDLRDLFLYAEQLFTEPVAGQENIMSTLHNALPPSFFGAWLENCSKVFLLLDASGRFPVEFLPLAETQNSYRFLEICLKKTDKQRWLERWSVEPKLLRPGNAGFILKYLLGIRQNLQDQERVLLWRLLAKFQDFSAIASLLKIDTPDIWLEDEQDGLNFFQWILLRKGTPPIWLDTLLYFKPELGLKPFSKNKPSNIPLLLYSEGMTPLEWACLHSDQPGLMALASPFTSPYTSGFIRSLSLTAWMPPKTMHLLRLIRPGLRDRLEGPGLTLQFPVSNDPRTAEWLRYFEQYLRKSWISMCQIKASIESYLFFFKHFEPLSNGKNAQIALQFLFNSGEDIGRERDLFMACWLVAHDERFRAVSADLRLYLFSALRNLTQLIENEHPHAREIGVRLFLSSVPLKDGQFFYRTPYSESFKQALRKEMQTLIPLALQRSTEEPYSGMSKDLHHYLEQKLWETHPEIPTRQLRQIIQASISILRKHLPNEVN